MPEITVERLEGLDVVTASPDSLDRGQGEAPTEAGAPRRGGSIWDDC